MIKKSTINITGPFSFHHCFALRPYFDPDQSIRPNQIHGCIEDYRGARNGIQLLMGAPVPVAGSYLLELHFEGEYFRYIGMSEGSKYSSIFSRVSEHILMLLYRPINSGLKLNLKEKFSKEVSSDDIRDVLQRRWSNHYELGKYILDESETAQNCLKQSLGKRICDKHRFFLDQVEYLNKNVKIYFVDCWSEDKTLRKRSSLLTESVLFADFAQEFGEVPNLCSRDEAKEETINTRVIEFLESAENAAMEGLDVLNNFAINHRAS